MVWTPRSSSQKHRKQLWWLQLDRAAPAQPHWAAEGLGHSVFMSETYSVQLLQQTVFGDVVGASFPCESVLICCSFGVLSGWKLSSFGPKDETLVARTSGSPQSVPPSVEVCPARFWARYLYYLYKSSPLSLHFPKHFVKCNKNLKGLLSLAFTSFINWTSLYC